MINLEALESAAGAIANECGGRRGMPAIKNIIDVLPQKLRTEVMEDAEAAIQAYLLNAPFNELADVLRKRGATVSPAPHGGDFAASALGPGEGK